jgi:hypothetical protein
LDIGGFPKLTGFYIPVQGKTTVNGDVKFDEDMWSSRSQVSPLVIERSEEVAIPKSNLEVREELDLGVDEESLGRDMSLHPTLVHRKPRWLT